MSGVEAYTAKLRDTVTGRQFVAVVRGDRTKTSEDVLRVQEADAYRARYGALERSLSDRLTKLPGSAKLKLRVAIRLHEDPLPRGTAGASLAAYQSAHAARVTAASSSLAGWLRAAGNKVLYQSTLAPFIDVQVDASLVKGIASREDVVGVAELQPTVPLGFTWFNATRADAAVAAGATGDGIPVCVWEGGQPPDYTHLKVLSGDVFNAAGAEDGHAQAVAAFIRNDSTYSMTPTMNGARTLIANPDPTGNMNPSLAWCLSDRSTLVVNNSNGSPNDGPGTVDSWQLDYFAKQPPWPLFVSGAGNMAAYPEKVRVDNRSYNTLIVGASDDNGTPSLADDTMWPDSEWKNPDTPHDDFELPHLVAPGVGLEVAGMTARGTSMSAPMVSAVAAAVIKRDYWSFYSWPEMTRAVLMATSLHSASDQDAFHKLSFWIFGTGGWNDARQGVGMLNAKLVSARMIGFSAARMIGFSA